MLKILLIDDHAIIRNALKIIIRDIHSEVSFHEASELVKVYEEVQKNKFDLIILDMNLGQNYFYEILRGIHKIDFSARVLVFTMNDAVIFARHVLRQGANGFLNKNASESAINDAIRTLLSGGIYIPKETENEKENPFRDLSDKEFEIFILLVKEFSLSKIAGMLSISVSTVATYQSRIFEKLKIESKHQLAQLSLRYNL